MAFNDNFTQTLKDFFFVNHPRKSKLIPEIVKEFAGNEKEVMMLLCKRYKVNPSTISGLALNIPTPAPAVESISEVSTPEIEEESTTPEEEVKTEAPAADNNDQTEEEKEKEEK
jgi:hypothetical protein